MAKRGAVEMVLAGDIGGTHARLRLYDRVGRKIAHEAVLSSAAAPSLAAIVREYLAPRKARVVAAVLGIAGPVVDGVAIATNLPWVIDERKLARELRIPKLSLLNDLAAGAVGCTRIGRSARVTLATGHAIRGGNIAVIAAGTGLGESLLIWDGHEYVPSATEGGHCDYGPNSQLEVDLLLYLRKKLATEHVSNERVLSGPGIGHVYDFFVERLGDEPSDIQSGLARSEDRNALITALGLSGESRAAAEALDLFARIYGAETGNLALKGLALGGIFLCGHIAAAIVPNKKEIFLAGLRNKGRMGELLARIPVTVVTDPFVGLTGAGYLAARLAAR